MDGLLKALADYLEMITTRLRQFGPMLTAEAAARSPRQQHSEGDDDVERPE